MSDPSTGHRGSSVTRQVPSLQRIGFVYLARESQGLVKIGYSIDPKRRVRDLEEMVGPCELLATALGTLEDERRLQELYYDRQVVDEWFGFLDEELPDVIAACLADCG